MDMLGKGFFPKRGPPKLNLNGPKNPGGGRVSHQTIYLTIYANPRGKPSAN